MITFTAALNCADAAPARTAARPTGQNHPKYPIQNYLHLAP